MMTMICEDRALGAGEAAWREQMYTWLTSETALSERAAQRAGAHRDAAYWRGHANALQNVHRQIEAGIMADFGQVERA